jgi:peptidoglycan hydrolase-like protein with peptidoglycan-binding domain
MRGTYSVPLARVGLTGLLAVVVLLMLPATGVASGTLEPDRPAVDSGHPLQQGAGHGTRVRAVQHTLRELGWQPGPADGRFGPRTEDAVLRFQSAAGLAADGIVGPQTLGALADARRHPLRRGAGYAQPEGSARVRVLQRELRRRGLRPGAADGRFGPRTEAAVARLHRTRGLPATGAVNAGTRRVLVAGAGASSRNASDPDRSASQPAGGSAAGTAATSQMGAGDIDTEMAILLAVLALSLGAVGGVLLGRLRSRTARPAVRLTRDLVAEGRARARSIGRFRGSVHALMVERRGLRRSPDARYLVSDPSKPAPFWVAEDEVSELGAPSSEGRPGEAGGQGPPEQGVRVLGYASVPEPEQLDTAAQREQAAAVDSLCEQRGWRLLEVVSDVEGPNPQGLRRAGLLYALGRVQRGEASYLVVSELRRLSRSLVELGRILEHLARSNTQLVAIDVGLDTGTPEGRAAARTLVSLGAWQRERGPERARNGVKAERAAGAGAPERDVRALRRRIAAMEGAGMSPKAIADQLNAERVPSPPGAENWRPSSVQAMAAQRRSRSKPRNGTNGTNGTNGIYANGRAK